MTAIVTAGISGILLYIGSNLFVSRRISDSPDYLNEERRKLHKKLIWLLPFVGSLLISGYWRRNRKIKIEAMTKEQREKRRGEFYESGVGLNS